MESQRNVEELVSVDAHEARKLLNSGHRYLDVRMREDFEKGHVEGAINVPFYSSVTPQGKEKNPQFIEHVSSIYGKDDHFIVGCRSGVRSKLATLDLLNSGFKNVKNMQRGYLSWVESTSKLAE
ncbi:rhodanese-like domain-containing protein 17 isoform X1 [Phoenix dactylifera]|uniref:Rhodanese-like domain-containing protein 17 isoform X1 n=1 Tax=Phoenix dactylifera TaxID=42345 RepID=A0A8B8ZX08_PHODC|nr:rhodanese-like domain-containing protein 17 isoform X1 [Phoenix dactylifera]